MKILVVLNDSLILKTIALYLKSNGHEIICSTNEFDVVEKIRNDLPNAIILDLSLLKSETEEISSVLKEYKSLIPLVIILPKQQEALEHQALELGAYAYLSKPFNVKKLSSIINELSDTMVRV